MKMLLEFSEFSEVRASPLSEPLIIYKIEKDTHLPRLSKGDLQKIAIFNRISKIYVKGGISNKNYCLVPVSYAGILGSFVCGSVLKVGDEITFKDLNKIKVDNFVVNWHYYSKTFNVLVNRESSSLQLKNLHGFEVKDYDEFSNYYLEVYVVK